MKTIEQIDNLIKQLERSKELAEKDIGHWGHIERQIFKNCEETIESLGDELEAELDYLQDCGEIED